MSGKHPEIIIIAALSEVDRAIGKNGKVPWTIPHDTQRFQSLTWGHAVIMGRKTWEDDVEKCPLPQRYNVVLSSQPQPTDVDPECLQNSLGLEFASSLAAAFDKTKTFQKVFIVGGAGVYAETLAIADTWELTIVAGNYSGDTFFPEYRSLIGTKFELVNIEHQPGFRYETYAKIDNPDQIDP
jgi:dihydrofolate reductase